MNYNSIFFISKPKHILKSVNKIKWHIYVHKKYIIKKMIKHILHYQKKYISPQQWDEFFKYSSIWNKFGQNANEVRQL